MRINDTEIDDTFAEAFPIKATRLVITAHNPTWARHAANSLTGFATSVIDCGCEAGIERDLSRDETPDGRPSVAVLIFAVSSKELAKQIARRVGQCVLTCPTTAVYGGIDPATTRAPLSDHAPLGSGLRFFGDGYQISKMLDDTRYWRVPVMDGEFVCEDTTATVKAVGGGNLLLLARDMNSALRAAESAVAAMHGVAEHRHAVSGRCGALGLENRLEVCGRDGLDQRCVLSDARRPVEEERAHARGRLRARDRHRRTHGRRRRRGDDGGHARGHRNRTRRQRAAHLRRQLRWQTRAVSLQATRTSREYRREPRMNAITLRVRHAPGFRVDASNLLPASLAALSPANLARVVLQGAGETCALGDVFDIAQSASRDLSLDIEGDARWLNRLGAGMQEGTMTVHGDAGDYAGIHMRGGTLNVLGNAGDFVAGALPGDVEGMTSGVVTIHGHAGARLADRMRRGTVLLLEAPARIGPIFTEGGHGFDVFCPCSRARWRMKSPHFQGSRRVRYRVATQATSRSTDGGNC